MVCFGGHNPKHNSHNRGPQHNVQATFSTGMAQPLFPSTVVRVTVLTKGIRQLDMLCD